MVENCSHNCEGCTENCSERTKESFLEKPNEMSHIKKVIGRRRRQIARNLAFGSTGPAQRL